MNVAKPRYSVAQNTRYALGLIWTQDKPLVLAILVTALAGAFLPFYGIYLPKLVIMLIEQMATTRDFIVQIGILTLSAALLSLLNGYLGVYCYWHAHRIRNNLMWDLFAASLHCNYKHIESAEGHTKYQKSVQSLMQGDYSGINRIIPALVELCVGFLGFALYAGVLSGLSPAVVVLLTLSSAINYVFIRRAQQYAYGRNEERAKIGQKIAYLQRKAGDAASGKDVRLYAMKGWFLRLQDAYLHALFAIDDCVEHKNLLSAVVSALLILIRDGFAYVFLIFQVTNGEIGLGDFALYGGAIAGFSNWITQIIRQMGALTQASLQLCGTRAFFDLDIRQSPRATGCIPQATGYTIEFRDVCFRYEGSDRDAISHLNLQIRSGEKLAIVGVNGAGKTTLVKLLCGFYKPDSGEIRINGVDISTVSEETLYSLYSAVFQEVFIAPFTVAENIALKTADLIDMDRVWAALSFAGLQADIEKIPGGINAPMTKIRSTEGVVLSGGQQQKLLLARALYKDAPILILDEPSAALDPIAESELYAQYDRLTRGKTSLYISHRLASTRFCDRIVLIAGGRIAEQGTHAQLIERNGEYARMFEIQSHYYRKNVGGKGGAPDGEAS